MGDSNPIVVGGYDYGDFEPLSEAAQKVVLARRERADKISNLIGQYLLRGHRMLAASCDSCGTVLLETKQKITFCVGCTEVDGDTPKDNPVLKEEEIPKVVTEYATTPTQTSTTATTPSAMHTTLRDALSTDDSTQFQSIESFVSAQAVLKVKQPNFVVDQAARKRLTCTSPTPISTKSKSSTSPIRESTGFNAPTDLDTAEQAIMAKIGWASTQLNAANQPIESYLSYLQLIRSCCDTLVSLRNARGSESHCGGDS